MSSKADRPAFYTAEEQVLPAHHQAALLVELALTRNMREDRLLKHTGLFPSDIRKANHKLSAATFRRLILNVASQGNGSELNLLWGSQLFPGHYGPQSTLLAHSGNLMEFLQTLIRFRFHLCPFMTPHLVRDERWSYLYWTNAGGAGRARPFLVAALISGVRTATNWLSGETLPWQVCLKQRQPGDTSDYLVAFGESVRFEAGIDLMRIESHWLFKPWDGTSEMVRASALAESEQVLERAERRHGLPELVYRVMRRHPDVFGSLDAVSEYLGMSSATLKRRLKECDTTYQAIHDEVRLHLSLYQFYIKGWSQEDVASYLNCSDDANFRRMFKRWTGLTPTEYRKHFQFQ